MVYSIQTGSRKGSRVLPNNRAIVLHQGGQCRWAQGMKAWLIRVLQRQSKRTSCTGQLLAGLGGGASRKDGAVPMSGLRIGCELITTTRTRRLIVELLLYVCELITTTRTRRLIVEATCLYVCELITTTRTRRLIVEATCLYVICVCMCNLACCYALKDEMEDLRKTSDRLQAKLNSAAHSLQAMQVRIIRIIALIMITPPPGIPA